VRGNWNNKEKSSPMILQKSCHDLDIISYVMDKTCERISSYGSLMHFHKGNAPEGAPERCLDGCPVEWECPFHAGRFYLGSGRSWARKFTEDRSEEHTSELQSRFDLVCRLLLEKKKKLLNRYNIL